MAIIATLFLIATAKAKETEDVQFFGSAYEAYKKEQDVYSIRILNFDNLLIFAYNHARMLTKTLVGKHHHTSGVNH